MTVATTTNEKTDDGNGITTAFSYPYYLASDSDLVVVLIDSNGNRTTQTLSVDYTISGTKTNGIYQSGVTVTMTTAPATGEQLEMYNDPALTQATDYTANDPFPAETHENALDKLTIITQRLSQRIGDAAIGKQWYKKSDIDLTNGGANDTSEWEWTALPSTTTMIRIVVSRCSSSGSAKFDVVIGDSGGYETSGYFSAAGNSGGTARSATSSFGITAAATSGIMQGMEINLTKQDAGSNDDRWIMTSQSNLGTTINWSSGYKDLSDTLTKVKFAADAGNFDDGYATLYYYA